MDKSAPKIEDGSLLWRASLTAQGVKVKKVDREPLKAEITGEHKLKKTETADKSVPVIESNS